MVVVGPARAPSVPAATPTVVVGVDGSPAARAALEAAAREAECRAARLAVVAAVSPTDPCTGEQAGEPRLSKRRRRVWSQLMTDVSELLGGVGAGLVRPVEVVVVEGRPVEVLVRWSERAELLVVGSRGQGILPGIVLGSVALRTLIAAPCPVMVVHPRPCPPTYRMRRRTWRRSRTCPVPGRRPRSPELGTSAGVAGTPPAGTVSSAPVR